MTLPVKNIIQGWYYKYSPNTPQHIIDQAERRAELCAPCLDRGYCDVCDCKTPHLFFAPQKEDARNRWGKMMSKEEWEKHLKDEQQIQRKISESLSDSNGQPVPQDSVGETDDREVQNLLPRSIPRQSGENI